MTRPYRELVENEAQRTEHDLSSFRSRALAVVNTSSGIVTLLTGLITFAASKREEEKGVPDGVIALIATAFALFLAAAMMALWSNGAKGIVRPGGKDLIQLAEQPGWGRHEADQSEEERRVTRVQVTYLLSVRNIADTAGRRLNWAIQCQIGGLLFTALAGVVAMFAIN